METNTNTGRRLISTAEAARRAGTSLRAVRLACERVPDLAVRLYPTARWKIDAAVLDRVLTSGRTRTRRRPDIQPFRRSIAERPGANRGG